MSILHLDNDIMVMLANPYEERGRLLQIELGRLNELEWEIGTSAIAWMEFLRGDGIPRGTEEKDAVQTFFTSVPKIVPFCSLQAEMVNDLIRDLGAWSRGNLQVRNDYMIAACALVSKAKLMTNNTKDFQRFERFELDLHPMPNASLQY